MSVSPFLLGNRSAIADRWPHLAGRVDQATAAVARVLPACRHVLAHGASPAGDTLRGAIVCAICTDRVACRDCHNAHITAAAGHDDDTEHRCDHCGQVVDLITPITMLVNLGTLTAPIRVRGLDGRRRQIVASLAVAGLGLCGRCMEVGA